jgi:hypothetical protein
VLPHQVLGNLTFINLVKPNTSGPEQAPQSKKQEKRLQQRLKAAQAAMPKLTTSYLTAKLLNHLEFTEEFEHLVSKCNSCRHISSSSAKDRTVHQLDCKALGKSSAVIRYWIK